MPKITRTNPKALETLNARLKELDGWEGKAGWFQSAVYANGTPAAYIASIHEFGVASKNIPPRPFMRPTIDRDAGDWAVTMGHGAAAVLKGSATAFDVFEGVGRKAADGIAKSISLVLTPPLKRATIMARLRRRKNKEISQTLQKPLVDTGFLLQRVDHTTERAGS